MSKTRTLHRPCFDNPFNGSAWTDEAIRKAARAQRLARKRNAEARAFNARRLKLRQELNG